MEKERKPERFLTIADLWHLCVARWRWFVVSICICLSSALYFLHVTPYMYKREASVLVIEESLGKNL